MTQTRKIKNTLDKVFLNNDTIFLVPHYVPHPDFDALGALLGIALICKKNKKDVYIIIDTEYEKFDEEEKKIVDYLACNFNVVNSKSATKYLTDKSLMISVDVNKKNLLSQDQRQLLDKFNNIVVIDHHDTDEHTIKTPYLFTNKKISSVCEEVAKLLFLYKIKFSHEVANYLFAGIFLDTYKLTKNASDETFSVVSKLISEGASLNEVHNMFLSDYEADKKMLHIINNAMFPTHVYAIAADYEKDKIYEPVDLAKASDYLLNYRINASFAIGYIDDETIAISARSKGQIDVASIMKCFGGGGNNYSAAARLKGVSMEDVIEKLNYLLLPYPSYETDYVKDAMSLQLKI